MQEKSSIKQNILQLIDYKGISKYKFYQKTGITRGILNQSTGMSEENILKVIATFPEISIDWLLTGEGSMLKNTGNENGVSISSGSVGGDVVGVNHGNYKTYPQPQPSDTATSQFIEQLKSENEHLKEQIKVKDEQIKVKDEQIKVKDEQIKVKDEQIYKLLTSKL